MWTWKRRLKFNSFGGVSAGREAKSADLREKTNDLHLSLESRGCYCHFSGLRLVLLIYLLRKLPWEVLEHSQMLYKPVHDLSFLLDHLYFAFCLHHLAFHLPITAS